MSFIGRIAGAARALVTDASTSRGRLWQNELTGLGTSDRDRMSYLLPTSVRPIEVSTLTALWEQDPVAGVAIDAIVDDGMKDGFSPTYRGSSERDSRLIDDVARHMRGLETADKARLAAKAVRAYGGGGLLLVTNGGMDRATAPLPDDQIRSLDRLISVDRRDLSVMSWDMDRHATYIYAPSQVTGAGITHGGELHASHLIMFPGVDTSLRSRQETYEGWDRPVLQKAFEAILDFRSAWQSTASMLSDGSQGVLKLPRLWEMMSSSEGRSQFNQLLSHLSLYRWVSRILPISSDEEFEWVERSYAGIAELLREHQPIVAQAVETPITRLFGVSPAGMNATGVSDERNWLSRVGSWRKNKIQPSIERVVRIIARTLGATDPDGWGIEWPSLEVLTTQERADLEHTQAEVDDIRIAQGVPAEAVLLHRYGAESYTDSPLRLSDDARVALERALDRALERALAGETPPPGDEI